jgi:uncharacterized C2H2 Zn-finger protein
MSRGEHTWEITRHYYKCPKCAWIITDRKTYQYRTGGQYFKELTCPRCSHEYTVFKVHRPSVGTLSGEEYPSEMEWNE